MAEVCDVADCKNLGKGKSSHVKNINASSALGPQDMPWNYLLQMIVVVASICHWPGLSMPLGNLDQ